MQPGQRVTYIGPDGVSEDATVSAVLGEGPSGVPVCDLRTATGKRPCTPYLEDEQGNGYWRLPEMTGGKGHAAAVISVIRNGVLSTPSAERAADAA